MSKFVAEQLKTRVTTLLPNTQPKTETNKFGVFKNS